MQENKDFLSKYGYEFQCKLIAALIVRKNFIAQYFDIIHPDYFENDSFKWIITSIVDYFKIYKVSPNVDFFKIKLADVEDVTLVTEIKSILRDAVKQAESDDIEFIEAKTVEFCSNQSLKQAIIDSIDYIKAGKFELIKQSIDKALNIGTPTNLGLDYADDVDTRYSETARVPIPTGWNIINELMKGGLAPGELGLIVGASGSGKSWLLMHIGAAAVKAGKKVLHISLELDENYTGLRYDSIFTGINSVNLNPDVVRRRLEQLTGQLKIKWFPTKSLSMANLRAYINKVRISGFDPDLIVLDYLDIMKLPNISENHLALTSHYEDARGLAGEEQLPIWSASQGNKESYNSDVLEADKVAGAYGKIFTADFSMSFSRRATDKLTNTGRAHIMKNRFGPDGMTFPVAINTYQGTIEIFNETSKVGKELKSSMVSNKEYERLTLKNRYEALTKKPDF